MDENKIVEQIKAYQEIAKENPNVDVAALMMNTLNNNPDKFISKSQKRWAYLISLGLPPLGLLFAAKFYLADRDKADYKSVIALTVFFNIASILLLVFMIKFAFDSVPGANNITTQQLQSLPQQYEQLYQ